MSSTSREDTDSSIDDAEPGAPDDHNGTGNPLVRRRRASRGQILILFAGALVALVGMLGLATDLGFSLAERRTMQNAADAGALAGAHAISKSDPTNPVSVLSDVQTAVYANKMGSLTPTITSCRYVDDTDETLTDCSNTVPADATGVHVYVTETHDTFFLRAVPGGPKTLTTRASAIAHVQLLKTPPGDGPFLVCGVGTKLDSGGVTGSSAGILVTDPSTGAWVVNPFSVNSSANKYPMYQVFGPNITTCGLNPQNFKGQAVGTNNENLTTPGWFYYGNGDAAGHVDLSVPGVDGCSPQLVINCVAFLPVAVDNPLPNTSTGQMWTVAILPFYLTCPTCSNGTINKIDGQLLENYVTVGEGTPGFIPGTEAPIVIRLTR